MSLNYKYSVDKVIFNLETNGFSHLPSIRSLLQKNKYFDLFKNEGEIKTFKENSHAHIKLIEDMDLEKLFKALFIHGKDLGLNVNYKDKYFISRYIKDGQSSEGYRGHFDSHFITIVLPVSIPDSNIKYKNGELFAIPNYRKHSSNEMLNIFQKIYYKKLNTRKTYLDLIDNGKAHVLNFKDYKPFIFYGYRTFHGNFPLMESSSERLTFLCHLFDSSPRVGIGKLLRIIRNR